MNVENENSFVVFFDDLDIGFNANDHASVDTLINLLRTSKHINNNIFSKNNVNAKVIILIRDDVERKLSPLGEDIAKLFSSYSTSINWYEEEFINKDKENELGLKKLIERRAKNAFDKSVIPMSKESAWDSLINDDFSPKTSFKYICDHTYLRPRDLILFFKPLETGRYEIPLNKYYVNSLLGQYASELVKELNNELLSFYSYNQVQNIFDSLKLIDKKYNCTYFEAKDIIDENCNGIDSDVLMEDLFERSLIGTLDKKNNFVRFKYKTSKKEAAEYVLDKNCYVIIHGGVKVYLQNR